MQKDKLICFLDGDAICIVNNDFLNIQSDLSVFIPLNKKEIKEINELYNFSFKKSKGGFLKCQQV